jgi:hypothetical protein
LSIRFFLDTHIAKQVAFQLRAKGVDVVRCQDVGMEDAPDIELFEYAIENQMTLITKDDDFLSLHNHWQEINRDHFGIFYCPYRDKSAIGLIVAVCYEYYEIIALGAGTIDDLQNEVIFIR